MQTIETKVESAALRMMDDVYRQTLYKAEIAMAAGATTLPQALDMATKDFLNAGINCIEYKDGRSVNIDDYAQMALRTAATKAYMQGEARKRDEMGIDTVLISQYGACSETCLPWQGRVYIDDVWGTLWNGSEDFESDWVVRKAKQVALGNKVVTFDQLPEKLKNDFAEGLKNADNDAGRLLYQLYRDTDYELTKEKKSLYRGKQDVVALSPKATPSTMAHELCHRSDKKYNISDKNNFEELLKHDYNELKEKAGGNVTQYLKNKYPEAFENNSKGRKKLKEEYRGISDILSAFGENYGFTHTKQYWEREGTLSHEAWAQFGRIKYENSDNTCRMLEEVFPAFTKSAIIALKKILGG